MKSWDCLNDMHLGCKGCGCECHPANAVMQDKKEEK